MADIDFAESYFDTVGQITSRRLQKRLLDLLELIQDVPTLGSHNIHSSLKDKFGNNCMAADISPFLLVFEYLEADDLVRVYGIVHQRSVH